ncbi:hypothetical protein L4C54_13080 [Vibrio lamellibrachiae]|uniref:hypothetical protein n=1 Tax=Vibrio lamellibrachiae TaxID=2910253 RepID=UPI003D0D1891
MKLQKLGGIAALIEALAYIVGFAVLITFLSPEDAATMSRIERLTFEVENLLILQLWYLFIYVVFGIVLVVLATALHEQLKSHSPSTVNIASVLAFIWSGMVISSGMIASIGLGNVAQILEVDPKQALYIWEVLGILQDAIGGGVEVVGGIWVLLISWVAMRHSALTKAVNYVGLVVGCAGLLTIIPAFTDLGAIFGLGQIAWFVLLGIYMLRDVNNSATESFTPQ